MYTIKICAEDILSLNAQSSYIRMHINIHTYTSIGNTQRRVTWSYQRRWNPAKQVVFTPDFTPAISSPPWHLITLPARFLAFFKVCNSWDESYFKAPTATSKRREAISRGAWEILSVCNFPHADNTSSNVPYFSSFTVCLKVRKKMHTWKRKRSELH